MNRVGKLVFKRIQRISPSQFYSMKSCAYKSLLAEAMNKKPLLPVSANAYYGTVLHKILELISKGVITNEIDFDKSFDEQVLLMEESLITQGYDFFVPLQKKVKDFIMKKILLKEHLRNVSEKPPKTDFVKFYSEKWFESKDKLISGKIDLIIECNPEIEILDFKTGAITQDFLDDDGAVYTDVKSEYKDQLKLYAYLYFENTGRFPTKISLVDLTTNKNTFNFSQKECYTIFDAAKNLLNSINECVDKGTFSAKPTETICRYCLYRPACSFYLKHLEMENSFNDISGSVQNVVRFQNGNVSAYLEVGNNRITVSNFASDKFDEFNKYRNKKINVFNLKKESREFHYSATKTTMIYE